MKEISIIGIDLAKNVFHLHAVDGKGAIVFQKAVRRAALLPLLAKIPACLIGMEACSGAHHWSRALIGMGHEVRLIPPAYVKAYVRRQKNDAADAAAICEAVSRPSMRFVPVKSVEQQGLLMLHRTRALMVGQQTALINALRGHLAEFGIVAAQGAQHVAGLAAIVSDASDARLPDAARLALGHLARQLQGLGEEVDALERHIKRWHASNAASRALATIPGIGPITASALVASITDPKMFKSGREFAAFLGLVPRQSSSGGKPKLGRISKMGDRYLRKLLVVGATSVLRFAKKGSSASKVWAQGLLARKPFKVVAVALANKAARIAWAIMTRGGVYRDTPAPAASA